ncbi:hypothetical protein GmHk_20G056973 [Glycine max]|nr:hypothetical protein GmHk_20G056973 [Glycine max]
MIDPPSPIRRHVIWKMACTKKTRQMTSDVAKEIADKIASQDSFVAHGRQDVLIAAIGRLEHPGRVRAAGAGVTIKQYFRPTPRTSCTSFSMAPEDLEQLTQMQSHFQSQMQSQGLTLPPKPKVGPLDAHVSTKESCVDPSGNDPDTGDSDKCVLYINENPPHLVALGRVMRDPQSFTTFLCCMIKSRLVLRRLEMQMLPFMYPLESAHWKMVIILPKENVVIWFCSLHNRPDNYLKGIINSALKGLDDTPQSKSKAGARWIVVKVSDLNNASTYILVLCRLICT